MSVAIATEIGAKQGILVKQGSTLERLSQITHIVFDKTGTLTKGVLTVTQIQALSTMTTKELIACAASVEQYSEHPVAKALCRYADEQQISLCPVSDFQSVPGRGVSAVLDGQSFHIGTLSWLSSESLVNMDDYASVIDDMEQAGLSTVWVVLDQQVIGVFGLQDQLRDEAITTVVALKRAGKTVAVLSGDRTSVVQAVIAPLGDVSYQAEVMPEDKSAAIQKMQMQGAKVAMVGDGINDAPALIQADVGIAMSSGTDVSVDSADVVISHQSLLNAAQSLFLSQRTMSTIRQNIVISISYNVIMVPLAMMALVNPLVAAITMPISSLLVIANAARIRNIFK
jgi:Cu2+-exporting ATPase